MRDASGPWTTWMLRAGAIGAVAFVCVFLVDGATRPGYDPVRHTVSALSLGERGWIQIANFIVTGLSMALFAIGLRGALADGRGSTWGPLLMLVFALGLVASGLWAMDPAHGYPPGTAGGGAVESSRHNDLHDAAGLLVFGSLPALTFVLARRFRESPDGDRWAAYSVATGLSMVGLFVAFSIAWEGDGGGAGLIQRAVIIVGWTWIALLGRHLGRVGGRLRTADS